MQTRTDNPAERGLCRSCNYALRGLSEPRCPECGRAFDPADPATMNLGRPLGAVGRWLFSPPALMTRACWVLTAPLLAASVVLPNPTASLLVLSVGTFLVGFVYVMRAGARRLRLPRYRLNSEEAKVEARIRWRARKILGGAALLLFLRIPFLLGFAVSVIPLTRMGHHFFYDVPFGTPPPAPRWIGLYPVRRIFIGDGGVWFDVGGVGTLVYSPIPDGPRGFRTWPLIGPWSVADHAESSSQHEPH